ncbi:CPBP family intramembrane glutamic endopeptidase [Sphingomonas turrisvirgatae]|uniref:CAAX prenyl protease 2/Lysostaphin resistance protein A-like domain-containing protein n=1 Tax=Sphingomonas turrisvirgatae TaxID=1888892 RepID=A0A1E3M2T0_9SPHN|nr:CPBP family intramembrane glutamic endopeptidase [Sphingomonas turrisvirgatae]ODP39665.1 hypothetical protein BFL28_08495 [Sphingomonas turrisvirgatae]
MTTTLLAWPLSAALLAAYLWYVRGGDVARGSGRIARYRRWMRRAPLAIGASSLVALWIGGRIDALFVMPGEFSALARSARHIAGFGDDIRGFQLAVLGGFAGGVVIGLVIGWWRARRGKRQLVAGNLERILPRTRAELAWTSMLAITAGVVEELFFRLALPLFATLASGSALLGFALALAAFIFAHRYQGRIGMAFSGIAGALMAILYLSSGSLAFAMLVHALLNLNGLVIRPALIRPTAP